MITPRDVSELQQRYLALWFGYALSATQLCVLACFWPAPICRGEGFVSLLDAGFNRALAR